MARDTLPSHCNLAIVHSSTWGNKLFLPDLFSEPPTVGWPNHSRSNKWEWSMATRQDLRRDFTSPAL
jgi:hypothetical protein